MSRSALPNAPEVGAKTLPPPAPLTRGKSIAWSMTSGTTSPLRHDSIEGSGRVADNLESASAVERRREVVALACANGHRDGRPGGCVLRRQERRGGSLGVVERQQRERRAGGDVQPPSRHALVVDRLDVREVPDDIDSVVVVDGGRAFHD